MLKKKLLAVAAVLLSSGAIAADGNGFYLGLAAGVSDHSGYDHLSNKAGFKFFGGYMLNKNFGFEAGFASTESSDDYMTLEGSSFYGALVGNWPVTQALDIYAKAGLGLTKFSRNGFEGDIMYGATDDAESEVMFGVGTRYRFSPNFGIQAEYERYHSDVGLISAGVVFSF